MNRVRSSAAAKGPPGDEVITIDKVTPELAA
jgi:hypothetical protein